MVVDGTRDATTVANALQAILEEKKRHLTTLVSTAVVSNGGSTHKPFTSRRGFVQISSNFDDVILSCASKKVLANEAIIGYADLAQLANDAEIGSELPEGHVFEDVGTFLLQLATLMEGLRSGVMLINGRENIFYVRVRREVYVVLVSWYSSGGQWQCHSCCLDDFQRSVGCRVFSATAA